MFLLASMSHQVKFQVVPRRKTSLADCTLVHLDRRVRQQVSFQTAGLCEPLFTVDAAVRLFAGVRPDVSFEVTAKAELAAAQYARVRALASVDARVDPKGVRSLKELAAQRALIRFSPTAGRSASRPGLLWARRIFAAVEFHMSCKAVSSAKLFLTIGTIQG